MGKKYRLDEPYGTDKLIQKFIGRPQINNRNKKKDGKNKCSKRLIFLYKFVKKHMCSQSSFQDPTANISIWDCLTFDSGWTEDRHWRGKITEVLFATRYIKVISWQHNSSLLMLTLMT